MEVYILTLYCKLLGKDMDLKRYGKEIHLKENSWLRERCFTLIVGRACCYILFSLILYGCAKISITQRTNVVGGMITLLSMIIVLTSIYSFLNLRDNNSLKAGFLCLRDNEDLLGYARKSVKPFEISIIAVDIIMWVLIVYATYTTYFELEYTWATWFLCISTCALCLFAIFLAYNPRDVKDYMSFVYQENMEVSIVSKYQTITLDSDWDLRIVGDQILLYKKNKIWNYILMEDVTEVKVKIDNNVQSYSFKSNNVVKTVNHGKRKYDNLDEEISCFLRGGRTVTEVAGYFGVSKKYVSKIKDGLNKKD